MKCECPFSFCFLTLILNLSRFFSASLPRCSPTPWTGVYCASKAALHSLTEVLQMECKPLNISVVLLAPGSIRSMIADNSAKLFQLPEDSLWKPYLPQIVRWMFLSQTTYSMPTAVFAQRTVDAILGKRGPPRYMSIGGHALQIRVLQWLPRGLILWILWRKFSR